VGGPLVGLAGFAAVFDGLAAGTGQGPRFFTHTALKLKAEGDNVHGNHASHHLSQSYVSLVTFIL